MSFAGQGGSEAMVYDQTADGERDRLVPRWRVSLGRTVAFAAADIDLLSLGAAPTAQQTRVMYGCVASAW